MINLNKKNKASLIALFVTVLMITSAFMALPTASAADRNYYTYVYVGIMLEPAMSVWAKIC